MPPSVPEHWCIAIDGPAASGKTEIGGAIARRLRWRLFDTGILYRALTWHAIEHDVDPGDAEAVSALLPAASLRLREPDGADAIEVGIEVGGRDATPHLREAAVEAGVSLVARQPLVRAHLIPVQHDAAGRGGLVVVGRDIGTVVLPEAQIKIFLTATAEVRARRRAQQAGPARTSLQVYEAQRRRDAHDMERAESPLVPAADAVEIDTTDLSLEQSVARAIEVVDQALAATHQQRLPI